MQIEIEVTGQKIKRLNSPGSVADTLNYLTCHFIFVGEEWDNTVRTAYFNNQKSGERYAQIIADDGTCTVPWEALTDKGFVRFSVAGEREDYRITTDVESFYNSDTIYGGNPSEPPTPDQYDQMIALAEQTKEIAESVRRDADEGKFDGDPGEPGAPGRDGVSPITKVEQTDDGAVITITDAAGTTTAKLKNGKEGKPGQNATDEQVRGAVDAYMAEHPVQVDTDDLIKIAIKEEASGAVPIVTTDSAEMGVQDLTMQGWTEQPQYEGKNLFDFKALTIPNDRTIIYNPIYLGDGTFTLSTDFKDSSGAFALYILPGNVQEGAGTPNGVDRSASKTVVSSEGYVTVAYRRATDLSNPLESDIMLNSGSTALPYEPYTGGKPSPSPDYPQEIISAGNYNEETGKYQYEVELTGGNLFDYSKLASIQSLQDGGLRNGVAITGLPAGTYMVYATERNASLNGVYLYVSIKDASGNFSETLYYIVTEYGYQDAKIDVKDGDTVIIYDAMPKNTIETSKALFSKFKIMFCAGETKLPYSSYRTPQTVTLTADRPLTKWDRLEKRNGQWGWGYKSMEITLDGSEEWGVYAVYEGFSVGYIFDTPRLRAEGFCESFICETAQYNVGKDTALWLGVNNYSVYAIRIPQYNEELPDSGLQDWKDWLSENPITILTYADEETFVPLTETEQSALNALTTYYPTTVLDNDQGCEMSVQYIADTRAYIDKKISAIQAAIVNTI